jgi:ubiquinone/menaquinone biosynthesis C-methylase UbiE
MFANCYDFFMSPLESRKFKEIRRELLRSASGKVLEIGSGTGINFPLYESVERVTAIEPNQHMIEKSILKKKLSSIPIEIINAGAEKLPFEDNHFDSVVATLVFCTIPDVESAIKEIMRVCKPGGKILLFEHVKMGNPFLAKLQDWLTPAWRRICDGCCLNRNTLHLIRKNGVEVIEMKKFYQDLFIAVELKNQ